MMITHTNISTWVFKIDDEFEGRGTAYFKVDAIKSIKMMLKKGVEINEELVQSIH